MKSKKYSRALTASLTFLVFMNNIEKCLGQRCFKGVIKEDNTLSAADCVHPDAESTLSQDVKPGDEYSTGNLDDFCLRTEISDEKSLSHNRQYHGVGILNIAEKKRFPHLKTFQILQKLVGGNTWSYQADGRIEIANIKWSNIQNIYNEQYKIKVQDLIDQASQIDASIIQRNNTYNLFTKPNTLVSLSQTKIDAHISERLGLEARCRQDVCPPRGCYYCDTGRINQLHQLISNERKRYAFYQAGVSKGDPTVLKTMATNSANLLTKSEKAADLLAPLKLLLKNTKRFPTPDFEASNPYFVEISGIKIENEILKNYLHIRVFLNRSVSDLRTNLHTAGERNDKTYGRIKGFLLMVKDQEGWPVGDFSHPIPCSKTCTKYGREVFTHDSRNDLPCAYTPPTATTHPGMFIWPSDDQVKFEDAREIHATWSFAQDSCNFVTELHFQTLIVEDFVERPGTDFFKRKSDTFQIGRPHYYGWTGRYNILHPTKNSLGAADYVSVSELRDLNKRGSSIDCHVPLNDTYGFIKGRVPYDRRDIPSHGTYFLQLLSEFPSDKFPNVHYFGQHLNGRIRCRDPTLKKNEPPARGALDQYFKIPIVSEFIKTPGIQCPCPALPTTPGPDDESVTPDPSRLHGRLLHGSHMAMAWMVLVPLAFFVARYYKETFSNVFCLQEYWWYMWHVGLMLAATAFVMGGIVSVSFRKNLTKLQASDLLIVHNILGAISIVMFYIQIFTGFFRPADPEKRVTGIFLHWLAGMLNQTSAITCVIIMGFVKQSGMTCNALIVSGAWVFFYLVMFGIMEFHMRITDRQLQLNPPRSYLPPPVMRLFGQDAPGRIFRIIMLGVFIIGLLCFYFFLISYIWASDGMSCKDELGTIINEEEQISGDNYHYDESEEV